VGNFLAFLLLIGPIIILHELGHLVAAKMVGVKVPRFSFGFGKPFARFRMGETEYCVAPFLLGGYVTLLGQNPYEEVPLQDADRALPSKPLWARCFVMAAGPLMNFVLPVVIYFLFYLGQTTTTPPVVGTVLDDTPAEAAGLRPGDRIIAVDGRDIRAFHELRDEIGARPDEEVRLTIQRGSDSFDRFITPRRTVTRDATGVARPRGRLGVIAVFYAPQIGIVDLESPAYRSGLRTGDIVTSINGEPVLTVEDLEELLASRGDALMRLTYLRPSIVESALAEFVFFDSHHAQVMPAGRDDLAMGILPANTFVLNVAPGSPADMAGIKAGDRIVTVDGSAVSRWESVQNAFSRKRLEPVQLVVQSPADDPRPVELAQVMKSEQTVYRQPVEYPWHGMEPHASQRRPDPEPIRGRIGYAVNSALRDCADATRMLWSALSQIVTFQRGLEDLHSVVGFYYFAGIAADDGADDFFTLMAALSLSVGFLNLLPIPILDGGHLLFFLIEAVRRRPLGQRAREIASAIGMAFVLILLLIALRNDIASFWLD
jgi:regulator of sigma E protease